MTDTRHQVLGNVCSEVDLLGVLAAKVAEHVAEEEAEEFAEVDTRDGEAVEGERGEAKDDAVDEAPG